MPIETPAGTLEVENAKFRASSVEATIAVGIGTESNDAYPLQVFKETSPDIRLSEGSTISSAARFYSNNSNLYIQTGTNFTSGSSGDIAFQNMAGQSTHMMIKSDGKVGVGTTNPALNLHVMGAIMAQNNGTITPQIQFKSGNSNTNGWLVRANISDTYAGDFTIDRQDNSVTPSKFVIKNNGNVGIGTTNPTHQLHIGPKDNDHIYLASSNNSYGWTIDTDDQGSGTVPFRIIKRSGGVDSTVLTIKNQNGNVGIGTTNPSHPLTIQETTTNTNTVTYPLAIRAISSGTVANGFGAGIRFQCERRDTDDYQSLAGSVEVYGADNIPSTSDLWNMRFGVRNNDTAVTPMTLRYDGNVGIGTTNPGTKLDVVGHPHTFIRKMAQAGTATSEYNHILGGPRPGTTSGGAVHFINGSARTSDGGTDTYTIRNDSGKLRLGSSGFETIMAGYVNLAYGFKSVKKFDANVTLSAGSWYDIGDFSGMLNGTYLLTVRWGNSSNPLVYWYGGASGIIYIRGDANASYNSQAGEDLRLNHWYHYRTAGEFEFILDSDQASGNYGNTTLWVKAPAACTINFGTYMTLLDNV